MSRFINCYCFRLIRLFSSPRYFASAAHSANALLFSPTSPPTAAAAFNAEMDAMDDPSADAMALVEIEIVTRTVSEVQRQRKFTFTDQIGTLGEMGIELFK